MWALASFYFFVEPKTNTGGVSDSAPLVDGFNSVVPKLLAPSPSFFFSFIDTGV